MDLVSKIDTLAFDIVQLAVLDIQNKVAQAHFTRHSS